MSVLENVLREEKERAQRILSGYENMLEKLPKGSICIMKIHNSSFVYRKYRTGKKVVSEYIGPLSSQKSQEAIELCDEYKRIKHNIVIAKQELSQISRAVKIYDRQRKTNKQNH